MIITYTLLSFGLIFKYALKPFGLFMIALQYYLCYAYWLTVKFFYSVMIQIQVNKKEQERLQQKINQIPFPHPDVYKNSTDIIAAKGYMMEIHTITTEDRYLLKAWRLYKDPSNLKHNYPIILQHGLLDCSWSWFLNDNVKECLPYILCDEGYDVWITNNRGNTYSLGHADYDDIGYNKTYWDFGFDEIAQYDVKANVLHIKKVTQKEKVIYLGHSQGSSQLFAHISMNPEFQQHLKCFIALGPAIFVSNVKSNFIKGLLKSYLFDILYYIGHPSFMCFDKNTNVQIGGLCYMFSSVYHNLLFEIVNLLCGYPERNKINLSRFGVMVAHEPGGASTKNVLQWLQFMRSKKFAMFDYGEVGNLRKYGLAYPPEYPVENLKYLNIPKFFYVGEKDVICDESDINKMIKLLDKDTLQVENIKDYAHLDYVWATDAHETLYVKIIKNVKEMQKS